ncbi:MAG: glutathione synthase/RimK-type ligase-like ATP-grasp enzyme [Akkermansiaceae bacterium]
MEVFGFELSKSAQSAQLRELGIDHPRSVMFNDIEALARRHDLHFPAMLKPEQGGSGARMHKIDSLEELRALRADQPGLWEPDQLLLLQEYLPHDPEFGIVRSAQMDVAGIAFLERPDGRRVFYDINANSNLRRPIGEAFGFDPFERVADYLEGRLGEDES